MTDSNNSTCLKSGIVEAFGIKMAGRGTARVSEKFLTDLVLICPGSSGVTKRTALNNPSRLSLSSALSKELHISKTAVYLSRQLITFSYTEFSHGA
jgi:hypothetical protein